LGQTKKSLGRVHLPKELADDLWLWKQECPASSPEAFIFPDAKGGFMDTGNYRRRVLHKLAKDLELPKLTFVGGTEERRHCPQADWLRPVGGSYCHCGVTPCL
jgi:hypothetical protein